MSLQFENIENLGKVVYSGRKLPDLVVKFKHHRYDIGEIEG